MKELEVPKPVLIAVGVLLVAAIGFGIFQNFAKPTTVVEPSSVSATRLEDPDPRSGN